MTNEPTLAMALAEGRAMGIDRLDAQLLLGHVLGRPRTWVLAHDDEVLDIECAARWRDLAVRRAEGEPLAYLLGEKEFHGLTLKVTRDVLVPRPETEVLVDRALAILRAAGADGAGLRVIDLGTGSGAIALAVKAGCGAASVGASDRSAEALAVARSNAAALALSIEFREGSWWEPWDGQRFHLALANPPYVAESDAYLGALRHEPLAALVSGADGLAALRTIVSGAAEHLEPGGWVLLEHGYDQAEPVREMLRAAGFSQLEKLRDLAGHPRCTGGHL